MGTPANTPEHQLSPLPSVSAKELDGIRGKGIGGAPYGSIAQLCTRTRERGLSTQVFNEWDFTAKWKSLFAYLHLKVFLQVTLLNFSQK